MSETYRCGVGARTARTATWVAATGAAAVAIGVALPWARSGRRSLSGYDLVGVARRFGLTTGAGARTAATLILALPLLAAVAVALAALDRRRGSLTVAAAAGLIGAGTAGWTASVAQGSAGFGVGTTLAAALCCIGACVAGVAHAYLPWRT